MFRIYCQFKPNVKRAAGGDGMGPRQGRGAWVVVIYHNYADDRPVVTAGQFLGVLCPTTRRRGTRCNPRKLLAEYQAARHA